MGYKNCAKCNQANPPDMRFCGKCGADMTTADELPPTVIGMSPPIMPPNFPAQQPAQTPPNFQTPQQSNFQQSPPPNFPPSQPSNFQQPQQNFQQPPPLQTTAPRSSSGKKIALIGGIGGLVVVIAGGIALWFTVIGPYFKEQARLKKDEENQTRANSTTAISLLPESYIFAGGIFRKGKTLDKMQLLQVSQNLPPELKSEFKDINDAAAAEYTETSDSSKKVLLQILKYNSPTLAASACDKVGKEVEKNQSSLKSPRYYPTTYYPEQNRCFVLAEDHKGGYTEVLARYGFLVISSGHTDSKPGEALTNVRDQLVR